MSTNEIVTLVISVCALILSAVAVYKSSKQGDRSNDIGTQSLALSHATIELELRNHVNNAQLRVQDFTAEHAEFLGRDKATLSGPEKKRRETLEKIGESNLEGYLNALDETCQKYLDSKVDRARFKKSFQRDIRQAVHDEVHKDYLMAPGHAFTALMKVYEEWENPEK